VENAASMFFDRVVAMDFLPMKFITDRDPRLVHSFWEHLCKWLGIDHRKTTTFHTQADGAVERLNCTLEVALRAYVGNKHREKKFLRCKRCHASNAANAPNEKPRSPTQKSRSATQNFKNAPSNVAVPTNAATCYQRSLYVAEREIRITNAAFPLQRSLPYRRSIALPTQHLRCRTRNPH
jgi:hypothetical protein